MVFNSIVFLVFFVCFFFIYWILNQRASLNAVNVFILLSSYLFYGWWDWRFLSLIIFSSTMDFWLALKIEQSEGSKRKLFLYFSIISNLSILCFFKYFNFFYESLNSLISFFSVPLSTSTLQIILPVGISFYTFQALSYTVDVYRNKMKASSNFVAFLSFVAFFPQLVAGPIERAKDLLPQFYERKVFSYPNAISGLRLVLWGFFLKIAMADNFAMVVNRVYENPSVFSGLNILIATCCFAFQIYCDFSGYSNIAIGVAKMLGFHLTANFKTPYFSSSITEFWNRWHISLSSWFKDYVYIPLGGNKVSSIKTNRNLLITFFLSGLWHGANYTFLIWGSLHGLLLVLSKNVKLKIPNAISIVSVFVLITLLWTPFRAVNTEQLKLIWERILFFTLSESEVLIAESLKFKSYVFACFFLLFLFLEAKMKLSDFDSLMDKLNKPIRVVTYYTLFFAIIILGNFNVKPNFIYFQF